MTLLNTLAAVDWAGWRSGTATGAVLGACVGLVIVTVMLLVRRSHQAAGR